MILGSKDHDHVPIYNNESDDGEPEILVQRLVSPPLAIGNEGMKCSLRTSVVQFGSLCGEDALLAPQVYIPNQGLVKVVGDSASCTHYE